MSNSTVGLIFLILYFLYLNGSNWQNLIIRLDMNLGVPDKAMLPKPLLGPSC